MNHSGIPFVDSKISCLQVLAWWVMDMKMWGKNIDFNNFKSDIIYDMIEES